MEKFADLLNKAEQSLRTADHMVYITYPLLKENRLLKKILEEIHKGTANVVSAILNYEYTFKRIELHNQADINFEIFRRRASRFDIKPEEVEIIYTIFSLMEKHKESTFEFSRKDKFVMMSNNLHTESVDLEQLKKYLNLTKVILKKTRSLINKEMQPFKKYF